MQKLLVTLCFFALLSTVCAQAPLKPIGRLATPAEIKAWDIDVRADLKGLPTGQGSVVKGQEIWDKQCASCHGVFGESNEVFPPLVGGTTAEDVRKGRVAGLVSGAEASRTTLMKLSQLSALWDYIHRAMPWNAPKSLSNDEVYAVVAYILHLGDLVPADFVLSDKNIAATQALLPNRNGMSQEHGLWHLNDRPDIHATACMHNCAPSARISSELPAYARDAHGNLADQMRLVGPVRGAQTIAIRNAVGTSTEELHINTAVAEDAGKLLTKQGCTACHARDTKLIGPSFFDISKKYENRPEKVAELSKKIREGGQGVWGNIPMPAQTQLSESEALLLVNWILKAKKE